MTLPLRLVCRVLMLGLALRHGFAGAAEPTPRNANPRLTGTPFMQIWRAEDYGASPVNWRVTQHPGTGFIYVANNFGVMEFDGAAWRLIPMPREGAARALGIDRRGVVWAAGPGDICRLEPDATGALRAVDVASRLPVADRVFGLLNRTVATRDGMYLASARRIFLFRDDGSVRVWRTEGNFSAIWALDDVAYVARDDRELIRLQPDGGLEVVATPTDPEAPLLRTYSAAREGRDAILLTRAGPAHWAGGDAPAVPFSPASAAPFVADAVRTTLQLADGRFALGTVRGAVVLSHTGELEQRLDVTHGLPVDTINGFAEDREGGLWIAMQSGLARVQIDSPFALHALPQGLNGGPRRLARFNDRLYLAHGGGVSWRNPADGHFEPVRAMRGGANRPVIVQGHLLVTTGTTLREVTPDGNSKVVVPQNFMPLIESKRQPGWLVAGDPDNSVWLLSPTAENPGWKLEGRLQNLRDGVVQLYDSGDGFVWAVTDNGAIWRVDFRRGLRLDAPCEQFDAARGVPPARRRDHVQLFFLGDDFFAASANWLLRYDAARGHFVPAPSDLGITTSADAIENLGRSSVWLHSSRPESQLLHLTLRPGARAGGTPLDIERFSAAPLEGMVLNSLFYEAETRTVWIAAQGALVSMDQDWHSDRPLLPPLALVRKISTSAGATLFAGAAARPREPLALEARQTALRFEFASPTFTPDYIGRVRTLYRTRIDGLDRDWTAWSPEPFRDVTNLPHRELAFRVQAQTADGRVSDEAMLAVAIASPWWLARWALAAYVAAGYGALFGFIALRTRALRQRAAELEAIVVARTAELGEKNQTLAAQNTELAQLRQLETEEKIAARLAEEKARLEVLRYQLNPHFLFNAFTSICAQLPPSLGGARATIERLTDFCRLTLFRPVDDENPTLADEMKMLTAYLDIEQLRWGDLLQVELAIAPDVGRERIPPLLLLPLVENALKYGGSTSPDGLKLRFAAWRDDSGLAIEVANSGTWVAPSSTGHGAIASLGIGHENLRQRLQRHYPGAHQFSTGTSDGWVTVRLRLNLPERGTPRAVEVATHPHQP